MDREELARHLALADEAERALLLARHPTLVDIGLAQALKAHYLDHVGGDRNRAAGAAAVLAVLAGIVDDPEIRGLATWTTGLATLQIDGKFEQAISQIDAAAAQFEALGRW